MMSYFLLGALDVSPAAQKLLGRVPMDLIARHAIHDHGNVTKAEVADNLKGADEGGRILSRYRADPTDPKSKSVLVVTHEGWAKTTITLDRK